MSKLYFVRHGESEWNVADKICGRTDIPLTKRGHEQAEETGKRLWQRASKQMKFYILHCFGRQTLQNISAK